MSRPLAFVRDHPLLTPLLMVYGTVTLLAGIFEFGPAFAPVNLLLLFAYIGVIRFGTGGEPPAPPAVQPPFGRSRDFRLAITVSVLQLAGVMFAWFVVIRHGWPVEWAANLRAAG